MTISSKRTYDPLLDVRGCVCIIAGACGGLGRAIVNGLAERGASLALLDTNRDGLNAMAAEMPEAVALPGDITDEASLTEAVAQTVTHFGHLDHAINAAGVLPISPTETLDEATFRHCIDTNITGAYLFTKATAGAMTERGGRVVHIASVSSFVTNPNYAAYASSKAGLSQMVRVMAREWASRDVLINAIGPALTLTPLTEGYLSDPEFLKNAVASIPMGRLGEPDDLVGAALLLLGPGGAFITGQTIYVDGGRTLV
jgi:NAD(P)-dependent dehydrogenase (short-subunit alcohol dehydrogenase family)